MRFSANGGRAGLQARIKSLKWKGAFSAGGAAVAPGPYTEC